MNEQKILMLASRLLLAGANQNAEETRNVCAELAAELNGGESNAPPPEKFNFTGFLKFTKEEVLKMPKNFARCFRAEGCTVYYRKRIRGKNKNRFTYEARFRRFGYNISASAPSLDILKAKFIEKIKAADVQGAMPYVPTNFVDFTYYYFENFYRRKVCAKTFKNETARFEKHIKQHFGNVPINRITPLSCQKLIDGLKSKGLNKTAQEVKSMLNGIFTMAVKHAIIIHNPLDMVFYKGYEQEHGKALSKQEEAQLFALNVGSPYLTMYAVALYCGLRPDEYPTAKIDGKFIVAKNAKQKDGKLHFKKIPITPMLEPYVEGLDELQFFGANRMGERIRAQLPGHKLYDLRTTFYTRCQEAGVAEVALKKFMGHSLGGLAEVYTDVSDEFLYTEGQKLKYDLPPICPQSKK